MIPRSLKIILQGVIASCVILLTHMQVSAQIPYPDSSDLHTPRIDSIIQQMSLSDMAAQTMVIRSKAQPTGEYVHEMRALLRTYPFGGVCFFAGTTTNMLTLQQVYKKASKIPLFISIDGEFGPAMRMTDIKKFPRQQLLSAITQDRFIYDLGVEVGRQCKMLGIQWNFLPVVDVNNNPLNPVINTRSFGENPKRVAHLAQLYLKGMQSQGIMGSAKHFPGHGDTENDSHESLPTLKQAKKELDSIHLYPFTQIIDQGVESIMVGHLDIPAYDSSGLPSSLNPAIVTGLLRGQLGYQGLIVTDGLEMQGVRDALKMKGAEGYEGEVEVRALAAGCDVLLLPVDPIKAVEAIVQAVEKGKLKKERLEEACRRILYYKTYPSFEQDYHSYPTSALMSNIPSYLEDSINSRKADELQQALYNQGVTLMDNIGNVIPISGKDYPKKICINIGDGKETEFSRRVSLYAPDTRHIFLPRDFDTRRCSDANFLNGIQSNDLIIVSVTNTNYLPSRQYGITQQTLALVEEIQKSGKAFILVVFAPPYALKPFYPYLGIHGILCGYQEVEESQRACADIIFGALPAQGKLPVSVEKYWPEGHGITTVPTRLVYRSMAENGFKESDFHPIDSIVQDGIDKKAYPGCQVLLAVNGNVVYNKCFGHESYDTLSSEVTPESIYDLASLTKILATTPAYMRLYENGDYELDQRISDVLPQLDNTNKRNITFRQVLCHQSGLKPYLPGIFKDTIYRDKPIFSSEPNLDYPYQVADKLYVSRSYRRHMEHMIKESPVNSKKTYSYSDLGFYYLNKALKVMTDTTLSGFMNTNFYQPMGLDFLGFHPLEKFDTSQIMPTENDTILRKRLIRGFVHDQMVSMMGGEGGSAGLFGNAEDVAVMCQMFLQNGQYGGIQYLDSSTLATFTSSQFSPADNRRGGGFDKPPFKQGQASPTAPSASLSSYGHSGFTGTYCWIDPEYQLVYVFLSNRVYPDAGNRKIGELGIRTKVLEEMYQILQSRRKEESNLHLTGVSSNTPE